MSRRIDVELTSARDDGTWTWRAAGARQPKGTVAATLLHPGAKVGDVVRAEVEMDVDGISILSVQPPKGAAAAPEGRIEILGPSREFQGVTSSLAPKSDRPRGRDRDRGDRGDRPDRGERRGRGERPDRGDRGERGERRPARTTGEPGKPGGPRPPRSPRADRADRSDRSSRPERSERPRPKRLSPTSKHRNAVLEALSPEQKPIAEQLLRGGIPAVRKAIDEQNASLRAEGLPEIKPDQLLAVAEELLPRIKTAEWHDRADAAIADVDNVGLRDLRSVVSAADANARDDETRALAGQLRDALERRVKEEREAWLGEVSSALDDGRLVRALRVANRAPDPTMRFPADLAMRLSQAASEALAPDTPAERWGALLEAVAASPVRTTVKPAGLPADAPEALLHAARQAAGRIPALATLLGMSIPPPPTPMKRIPPRPTAPPQARARTQQQPAAQAQPEAQTQQGAQPEAQAHSEPEAHAQPDAHTHRPAQSEPEVRVQPQAQAEAQSQPEAQAQQQPQSEPEPEPEAQSRPEPEPQALSEGRPEASEQGE
jgi:hypothetical protein